MKLIYITNARIPTEKAHGVQIMKSCEAFADAGVGVELWVSDRATPIAKDPFDFYGVRKNFTIVRIRSFDAFRFEGSLGRLSFWIQSASFLVYAARTSVPSDALVYTRNVEIAWLFSQKGRRVVYEAHAWPESKGWLLRQLLKHVDFIICNSKGTEAEFKKNGFGNTFAVPNGVDMQKFKVESEKSKVNTLKERLGLPKDKKIVMYTGHLYIWKGADVIIEIADALRADERILFVLIGGTQQDVAKYQGIIKDKKLTNVLLLGHKEQGVMPEHLACADVLLLPNIPVSRESERYTSPIKMFEYMASKKQIVASDRPSLREILNERNAIVATPGDAESFVEGIKKTLAGDSFVESITAQAFADVQNFTWEKRAQRILNFLSA